LNVVETKFYVVDDGSTNRTHEYESSGEVVENYTLASGNSGPRGAASTAAGDRVWVIDASRRVYVYDTGGSLLGSWTAGTMSSSATPHGIATDGTDVWIVDDKNNRVYRYAGAATRLSGSQSAAISFNLNGSNGSPRDIVTDGTSLWVVNDSTSNKVFKYTVGGNLMGSWTIDPANSQPTGLTIDPANVSDIWIVDSSDDRVYQYAGAASRTSGSQNAASSFALAAGNSNPQGIADPPQPKALQPTTRVDVRSESHDSAAFGRAASSIALPAIAGETRLARKRSIVAAREHVFESVGAERYDFPSNRAVRRAFVTSEKDVFERSRQTGGNHLAVDEALESVFAGAFDSPFSN
jgi:hypothetical protein